MYLDGLILDRKETKVTTVCSLWDADVSRRGCYCGVILKGW